MNGKWKRKPAAKKRTTKKAPSQVFARKVRAVIQKVAETKSMIIYDTEITTNTLSSPTANHVVKLNAIGTGANVYNRVGTKISPKWLNVRGSFFTAADPNQTLRLMVVEHDLDSDPLTELLEVNSGAIGPPGNDYSAIYARINTTKFKVLATKTMTFGYTAGSLPCKLFNFTIKLGGAMHFEIGDTTPSKRTISLVWYNRRSDNDESTGSNGELSYNSKFYYQDM